MIGILETGCRPGEPSVFSWAVHPRFASPADWDRARRGTVGSFIPTTGDYVYADGALVGGPVKLHDHTRDVIENPRLVVEVLSKSTEHHDRDEKWQGYRGVASLTDYLLVSQRVKRARSSTSDVSRS